MKVGLCRSPSSLVARTALPAGLATAALAIRLLGARPSLDQERVLQAVLRGDTLLGIQDGHLMYEVGELLCLFHIKLVLRLHGALFFRADTGQHHVEDAPFLRQVRDDAGDLLPCHLVSVEKLEIQVVVEVLLPERLAAPIRAHACAALDHLVRHLALDLHEQSQHVVVRPAGEEDLASEKLVDCAAHREHVQRRAILCPQYNLGRAVEAAHEVWRRVDLFRIIHRAAQIANLHDVMPCTDQDVVGLYVRVDYVVPMDVS
mmetsp:Transcript_109818/g.309653  ORF Transcript_109818/g.309653 Transcript_109818/m.309653 type:complete len:260 (-) Transcript_109818:1251-2030(-)